MINDNAGAGVVDERIAEPESVWCEIMGRPKSKCGCPDCGSSLIGWADEPTPCGGCGETDEAKRCLGCRHVFVPEGTRGAYPATYCDEYGEGYKEWNAQQKESE